MKTFYEINSHVSGDVSLKRRKMGKELQWWLCESGFFFTSTFFILDQLPKFDFRGFL
jgi:hypothetical protein